MSVIERNEHVWAIEFSNGWQYTPSIEAAEDAKRQGLNVVGYVPASLHRGAVDENEKLRLQVSALENDGMELAAKLGEAEEQIARLTASGRQ